MSTNFCAIIRKAQTVSFGKKIFVANIGCLDILKNDINLGGFCKITNFLYLIIKLIGLFRVMVVGTSQIRRLLQYLPQDDIDLKEV